MRDASAIFKALSPIALDGGEGWVREQRIDLVMRACVCESISAELLADRHCKPSALPPHPNPLPDAVGGEGVERALKPSPPSHAMGERAG